MLTILEKVKDDQLMCRVETRLRIVNGVVKITIVSKAPSAPTQFWALHQTHRPAQLLSTRSHYIPPGNL